MKFREIVLLLFIICAGTCVYFIETGGVGNWFMMNGWNSSDFVVFPGKEFAYEETRTFAAPLPAGLEIDNGHGWVELRGEDRDDIKVVFKKRIWRRDEADARQTAAGLRMTEARKDGSLVLGTNREVIKRKNFETGFIVSVPKALKVTIRNGHGTVDAASVAELVVENRHGKVVASDIAGRWDLKTGNDDIEARMMAAGGRARCEHGLIKLRDIGGDIVVSGEYNQVSVEGVRGTVEIDSSHEDISVIDAGKTKVTTRNASVKAEKIHGDLAVTTSHDSVRVSDIEGSLSIEGGNVAVDANRVAGPSIRLSTSYEDAAVAGFSGRLEVSLRNGNLVLKPDSLKNGMTVNAENCAIDLYWPDEAAAPIEARSKGGEISWELRDKTDLQTSNGTSVVKAFGGAAGAPISIITTYGDIRIIPGAKSF